MDEGDADVDRGDDGMDTRDAVDAKPLPTETKDGGCADAAVCVAALEKAIHMHNAKKIQVSSSNRRKAQHSKAKRCAREEGVEREREREREEQVRIGEEGKEGNKEREGGERRVWTEERWETLGSGGQREGIRSAGFCDLASIVDSHMEAV
eukprot:1585589-Rhodomonas_salina.3